MKKLTSIILSGIIILNIFCGLGITVSAKTSGDYEYSITDNNAVITVYYGSATELIIPSQLDGYAVTSIGSSAFEYCTSLNSITIPNSVTSIGESAFYECSSLNSVTIGNSVTSIGDNAFSCTSLKSVTIPNSVTSIGESAFYRTSLKSITIPNSVTYIGKYAFNGCTSLTNIYVDSNNKNYTSVNGNLYNKNKTELIQYAAGKTDEYFSIPSSVTSIGDLAFDGCKSLMSVTIPDSVTSIGDSAFSDCTSLNSITIPDSVTRIGDCAFYFCTSLKSVTIPDSVTSIGDGAFGFCYNLNNIYYSGDRSDWENINIGSSNDDLSNATIHYNSYDGGTTGDYTWISTEPIAEPTEPIAEPTEPVAEPTEPIVEPTEPIAEQPTEPLAPPPEWRYRELSDNTVEAYLYIPPYSYGEFYPSDNPYEDYDTIPSSYKGKPVTRIGNAVNGGYYYGCSIVLDFITIPENVTHIESGAFPVFHNVRTIYFNAADCKQAGSLSIQNGSNTVKSAFEELTSAEKIVFGDKVKTIPDFAFGGLINLKDITIPESVTSIGKYAFYGCTGLTSITLPASITSIGKNAFDGCTNLSIAYVSEETSFDSKSTFPSQTVVKILKFFTIHYNANGGNGIPEDQIKKTGDTINLSVMVPTRKYHTFVGWTEHLCSDKYYQPGSAFTEDRNITLFAVWGMDCYYCNGKGKTNEEVTCKYCKGKGSVNATVKCSNCEGSGEIIANVVHFRCEVCNGTGFYGGNNCFRCKGLGYYTQRELATCPKCSGTGKVNESRECRYCWGDGYRFEDIMCTECEGKGKIIEKADHKCEWVVTKPATKTQTGIKENRCVVCGAVVESKIIPKITKFILGDVDSDGDVSIIDATCIQRHLAELATVSYNEIAADADGDGEVTILDATSIQRYLAELPCFTGIGNPIS